MHKDLATAATTATKLTEATYAIEQAMSGILKNVLAHGLLSEAEQDRLKNLAYAASQACDAAQDAELTLAKYRQEAYECRGLIATAQAETKKHAWKNLRIRE